MGVWHTYSTRQTLSELETDKSRGLSGAEAERRLARWGPNRLEEGRRQGQLLGGVGQMKARLSLVLLAAVAALYFVDSTAFEGLLPSVMSALSLFERFYTFVNGVFDLTAVFYYLTVAALFLFLSVQSLEKRRYN